MKSGETIIFETPDCWGNALTEAITKGELYAKGLEMNPCGGPGTGGRRRTWRYFED